VKRRTFFSTLATAALGFTILPPATTYARIWKAMRTTDFYVNQQYRTVPYDYEALQESMVRFLWNPTDFFGEWRLIGLTDSAEISRCLENREKFLISQDRHPFRFPNPEEVWPVPAG